MQKTIRVEIKIINATVHNVDETIEVCALWKRGTKSIDTRKRKLGPTTHVARFNDTFQMKTKMNWDET